MPGGSRRLWRTSCETRRCIRRIEQAIKHNFVRSHTFRFVTPVLTEQSKVPNPCTSCHADKTNAWALKKLKGWVRCHRGGWSSLRRRWRRLA